MSSYQPHRLDRLTAEQLLAGDRARTTATLAVVLRAAAAPARPEELAGEHAAVAAYLNPTRLGSRRPAMLRSALAKGLTLKAAIIVATLGTSGVVLAASTGALPVPWSGPTATPPATSRTTTPSTPSTPPSVTPTGRPSDTGKPPATAPDPSMAGLCNAYAAKEGENPGKALESPAFAALIAAAGGRDQVPAYCDTVTKDQPTGKPSDAPAPGDDGKGPSPHPTPPNRPVTPDSPAHPVDPKPSGVAPPHRGG